MPVTLSLFCCFSGSLLRYNFLLGEMPPPPEDFRLITSADQVPLADVLPPPEDLRWLVYSDQIDDAGVNKPSSSLLISADCKLEVLLWRCAVDGAEMKVFRLDEYDFRSGAVFGALFSAGATSLPGRVYI